MNSGCWTCLPQVAHTTLNPSIEMNVEMLSTLQLGVGFDSPRLNFLFIEQCLIKAMPKNLKNKVIWDVWMKLINSQFWENDWNFGQIYVLYKN